MGSEELKIIYVATVKPSGGPHVVPMLALSRDGKIYFETDRNSVKVRNILNNNSVVTVTPGSFGGRTVVTEGKARIIGDEEVTNHLVADIFGMKHPWRPKFGKESAHVLIEVIPKKTMKV